MGFMMAHIQVQHGTGKGPQCKATLLPLLPSLYRVSFRRAYGLVECPLEGYRGRALMRTNLRIHFVRFHVQDTIVIL